MKKKKPKLKAKVSKSKQKRAIIAAVGKLNTKHKLFVKEYVKDQNATRAYTAVYGGKGAAQSAAKLLRIAKIQEAVEEQLAALADKLDITAERTLKRIADIAYHDKWAKNGDVLKACELLGKHFKLFTDVVDTNVKGNLLIASPAEVKRMMDEVEKDV